jgi:hypothetical protein
MPAFQSNFIYFPRKYVIKINTREFPLRVFILKALFHPFCLEIHNFWLVAFKIMEDHFCRRHHLWAVFAEQNADIEFSAIDIVLDNPVSVIKFGKFFS